MLSIAVLWIFNKFYAKNFLHLPATLLWECNLTQNLEKMVFLCCQNELLADTCVFRKGGNRRNWELKMTLFQPQRIFFEGKQCLFRGKTLLFPSPNIHSKLGKHALQAGKTSTLARQSATLAR